MSKLNPYEAPQCSLSPPTDAVLLAPSRYRRTVLVACSCQCLCVLLAFALAAAGFTQAPSMFIVGYLLLTVGLMVFAIVIRASALFYAELLLLISSILLITYIVYEALGEL